eukprot:gnl/MRDRNA2_/MRDRNA2_61969_c0_seq1.p1 gnl/MRDRNA2_/MRDRNA2_61969_c0~~gnl/MRDRNA2_/MRDRNA2_61969_c0_seq1.p1  ORF type:complete len:558 (-),score=83.39 gnl/MRDRNA2_/MRDRNA2_61969_c0_seq1:113-1786(-)
MGQSRSQCAISCRNPYIVHNDVIVKQELYPAMEVEKDDLSFKIHSKWSRNTVDTDCSTEGSVVDLSTKRKKTEFVEKKYMESLELENDDECHCEVDPWMFKGYRRLTRGFSVNLGKPTDHFLWGDVPDSHTDSHVLRRSSIRDSVCLEDQLSDLRQLYQRRRCNSLPVNLMHRRGDDIHLRNGAPWAKKMHNGHKGPCLSPGDLRSVWEGHDGSIVVSHTHGMMTENQAFKDERERALYGLSQDEMFPEGDGPCTHCLKGRKGRSLKEPNQDNFSLTHTRDGWGIACVADGHGEHGHWSSTRTVQTVPYHLVRSKFWPTDMRRALSEAFEKAEKELVPFGARESCDIQSSGTTFVCLVWKGSKLWSANVGDSRLIVSSSDLHGDIVFETKDHKVQERQERKRLEAAGCEVKVKKWSEGHKVARVFRKGYDYPGLCTSRVFGDFAVKKLGIIAEPDIHEINVDPNDRTFAFLASDGVWDFFESKNVTEVIGKALRSEGPQAAVDAVLEKAHESWKKAEGDLYCDDITAVLIPLGVSPNVQREEIKSNSTTEYHQYTRF